MAGAVKYRDELKLNSSIVYELVEPLTSKPLCGVGRCRPQPAQATGWRSLAGMADGG